MSQQQASNNSSNSRASQLPLLPDAQADDLLRSLPPAPQYLGGDAETPRAVQSDGGRAASTPGRDFPLYNPWHSMSTFMMFIFL